MFELYCTSVKCVWSECGQVVRHSESSRHLGIGSPQVEPKEGCVTDTFVRDELLTRLCAAVATDTFVCGYHTSVGENLANTLPD